MRGRCNCSSSARLGNTGILVGIFTEIPQPPLPRGIKKGFTTLEYLQPPQLPLQLPKALLGTGPINTSSQRKRAGRDSQLSRGLKIKYSPAASGGSPLRSNVVQLTLRDSGLLTPPANETKQYARSRDHCGRGAKKNKMKKKNPFHQVSVSAVSSPSFQGFPTRLSFAPNRCLGQLAPAWSQGGQ